MVASALFYKNTFLACANPIKNNCLLVKRKPGRNFSGPFSSNHFAYACYEKKKFNHVDLRYCLNSLFTQHFILVDHHFSTRFIRGSELVYMYCSVEATVKRCRQLYDAIPCNFVAWCMFRSFHHSVVWCLPSIKLSCSIYWLFCCVTIVWLLCCKMLHGITCSMKFADFSQMFERMSY